MRSDLLALSPDKLAALANRGLVKRAQKMVAEAPPRLELLEDGTLLARDGEVETRLPAGVPLTETTCSCQARMCRHRLAAVLAYAAQGQSRALRVWSPGEFSDDALERLMGSRAFARARAEARRGLVGEIGSEEVPTVRLATTTIRFLVEGHLEHARCDCQQRTACPHLALAVWLWQAAEGKPGKISLGAETIQAEGWEPALEAVHQLLSEGVAQAGPGLLASLERQASGLERLGWVWPSDLMRDLAESLQAYQARSAAYSADGLRLLLTEVEARARASQGESACPARVVLGLEQAGETSLDHLDLVGLGARLRPAGQGVLAEVYLADPASATVLVLRKELQGNTGPEVANQRMAPEARLAAVAAGRLVTGQARRRPNRQLLLGRSRLGKTTVTPQAGQWQVLPPPLLVDDYSLFLDELKSQPPALIRARLLAEGVRVVRVAQVGSVGYSRATQTLTAELLDGGGRVLLLRREHRAVAPGALDALAAALEQGPGYVSGRVDYQGGLHLDPLAVVTDRVVVPDLTEEGPGPLAGWAGAPPDPLEAVLEACQQLLTEAGQRGLRQLGEDWCERLMVSAGRVGQFGLASLAEAMRKLSSSRTAVDWLDCALKVELSGLCLAGCHNPS
ncbi:MAG: SWIM zinc finger family protein [Candidatus Eremiobacteraeota bacterium]|nr:SWIM zinc finger family protein [Candidatus Eremiobacteraeota bacterium]